MGGWGDEWWCGWGGGGGGGGGGGRLLPPPREAKGSRYQTRTRSGGIHSAGPPSPNFLPARRGGHLRGLGTEEERRES